MSVYITYLKKSCVYLVIPIMFEHVLTLFMRDANPVTVLKNLIMGGWVCKDM